jgi:hypothetical protein
MRDQIIRDIPLIERYSRRNEAEDYRFRLHLKTTLNLSNEELDAVVRETTDAVWKQIDCTTCAHCCRTLQIVVDRKDIERLAARFNLSVRNFSRRYIAVAEDKTKHFSAVPCPFLGQDNRCTVYEDRPQACRDYPYLYEDHFRSRTLGMIANAAVCPIVFNVWQTLKHRFKRRKHA